MRRGKPLSVISLVNVKWMEKKDATQKEEEKAKKQFEINIDTKLNLNLIRLDAPIKWVHAHEIFPIC